MLDFLKTILGAHYTEEIDKKISDEIGKGFVARADFNNANEAKKGLEAQIAERDKQLTDLKKAVGDTDKLNAALKEAEEKNAAATEKHKAEIDRLRLDTAVDKALTDAGAKNATATRALLAGFLKDAKVGEDGNVRGLTAEIETLSKAEGTAFLFKAADTPPAFKISGMKPGEAGDANPVKPAEYGVTSAAMNQFLRGEATDG